MPVSTDTDGALFEQMRPRLKAISCRIVGSEAEAEDIVQDCFLKWHGADQAALATPVAWLTTVVQHHSVDILRKRVRENGAAHTALELAPAGSPAQPEDNLLRREEMAAALARLLACLTPSERLALVLHEVFDCKHDDIAAALGTKSANTRQYLTRARRRLRLAKPEIQESDKLSRELIRRFQAAINGMDVLAMVSLLGEEQPVSVREFPQMRLQSTCANDALYSMTLAA